MRSPLKLRMKSMRYGTLEIGIYLTVGGTIAGLFEGAHTPTAAGAAIFGFLLIIVASLYPRKKSRKAKNPQVAKPTKTATKSLIIAAVIAVALIVVLGFVYYYGK